MNLRDDPTPEKAAAVDRLIARVSAAPPPAVSFILTDTVGHLLRVAARDVHAAIERALDNATLTVGRDFWTGQPQCLTVTDWHTVVERHIQAQAARIAELETAAQAGPCASVHVTVPPPIAVERVQTVERDADKLITRTITKDLPVP